jgi:3-methylcrotonyl-CoA carboxylase beta subunit
VMRRIRSHVDVRSPAFLANREKNLERVREFRERQEEARFSRPRRDLDRLARQGKLFVRERIEKLLDPGTPFLELSSLAACTEYDGEAKGASSVVGIGIVSGREVVVRADDPSIKGGAWYPLTVKKIVRALDVAIENRLPMIHVCDSAGGFLPLQADVFPDRYLAGRIFRNQSILSKMRVPQLSLVFGRCTAGGAYIPSLSDYSVIQRGNGAIFLGGPPLVKAATGEVVDAEALGGADLHTRVSGVADYAANSEEEAILLGREIVSQWEKPRKTWVERRDAEPPYYDPEELYGIVPADVKVQFDMREVIARIVDGSLFHEYQPDYGTTLVCGFAWIWGVRVGILANDGVLFNDSSLKGAHFMELCNHNRTPLVFLQNITGYMVGREAESKGICKDGAKMIMIQSTSDVPKFTIMCNRSFGAGNYGMCGRAFDSRFLFSWPNHQIGVMGPEQAADVLADVKIQQLEREGVKLSKEEVDKIRLPILEPDDREISAYYATSHLWDDGIIDPVDTRNVLGLSIHAALSAPFGEPGTGVLRL